jgi:hypothetical protein
MAGNLLIITPQEKKLPLKSSNSTNKIPPFPGGAKLRKKYFYAYEKNDYFQSVVSLINSIFKRICHDHERFNCSQLSESEYEKLL